MKDTDNILFRCHNFGELMTSPKGKNKVTFFKDGVEIPARLFYKLIEQGNSSGLHSVTKNIPGDGLSDSAKSLLKRMHLENEYGYREVVNTLEMKKGHLCEVPSINILNKVYTEDFRVKYSGGRISNGFIIGTPDLVLSKSIEDVKSPFTLDTYSRSKLTTLYEWQGRCYMWLTGLDVFKLQYVIHPHPEQILREIIKSLWFKYDCDDQDPEFMKAEAQLNHNNDVINAMTYKERVKTFVVERDKEKEEEAIYKIDLAREYYKTITI